MEFFVRMIVSICRDLNGKKFFIFHIWKLYDKKLRSTRGVVTKVNFKCGDGS